MRMRRVFVPHIYLYGNNNRWAMCRGDAWWKEEERPKTTGYAMFAFAKGNPSSVKCVLVKWHGKLRVFLLFWGHRILFGGWGFSEIAAAEQKFPYVMTFFTYVARAKSLHIPQLAKQFMVLECFFWGDLCYHFAILEQKTAKIAAANHLIAVDAHIKSHLSTQSLVLLRFCFVYMNTERSILR